MNSAKTKIEALKVRQWLKEWDNVEFDEQTHKRKPPEHFYIFSLLATTLKKLSGIQRRVAKAGKLRSEDLGIQRRHDEERSKEIYDFIKYGWPWSEMASRKRESGYFEDLRKPGWLPTSIVINILLENDKRREMHVHHNDLIKIENINDDFCRIILPDNLSNNTWQPKELHPIEIIDGQHRLWAFQDYEESLDYELPVVAFYGLDISWQAYLFWTINIKPKRINASLAFDLYPLLRTEDWLEKFHGHSIYRESRAQEIVEILWAYDKSPWYNHINMLGERGSNMVSQAAWIRSLMATFVKKWEGRKIGGLFGAPLGSHEEVLNWSKNQQAAFLVVVGQEMLFAINKCDDEWARQLRLKAQSQNNLFEKGNDAAFYGPYSLLNADQGIRGLLAVINDICYLKAFELELNLWEADSTSEDLIAVESCVKTLKKHKCHKVIKKISNYLAIYDWRTSSAPGLNADESLKKAALRGSGGYKELRKQLLVHLSTFQDDIGNTAKEIIELLGY